MIEISAPLPNSKPGFMTLHDLLRNGERIGYSEVTYLQKDNVKAFKKYAKGRKLSAGKPYGTRVFIDTKEAHITSAELGNSGLLEVATRAKEKYGGLEGRDLYLRELTDKGRR